MNDTWKDKIKNRHVLIATFLFFCLYFNIGKSKCYAHYSNTWYVTNAGSGNHTGTSYDNAMSVAEHNTGDFKPGDTVYIAGMITSLSLVPPSSGTANHYIIYRGDYPGHPGSLEQTFSSSLKQLMLITNKEYIKVINLIFNAHDVNDANKNYFGLLVTKGAGPTGHVEINGCTFNETVTGIFLQGGVKHIDVFRSIFKNMVNNGVATYKHSGSSVMPSYITVGGSRENGNIFLNIGREDLPKPGSVPGQTIGTQANDLIFSYNHIYADTPGWGAGIYLNGVSRVLVEYNYIHDLDAVHRRDMINFKSDDNWKNSDIIIRFNKVGPAHQKGAYTNPTSGIRINRCLDRVLIYGNFITNVEGLGIYSTWGWGVSDDNSDGCIPENVFIYSNIISRTTMAGMYMAGTPTGADRFRNTHICNNLFYKAGTGNSEHNYGIELIGGDRNYENVYIKNNIIDSPQNDHHISIKALFQNDIWYNYNHHHSYAGTPSVFYDGSSCSPCEWNSADLPDNYGTNDTKGDPCYYDAENDIFSLTENSPCINTGENLNVPIPQFEIQGKFYNFDIGDGIDPEKTEWKSQIPIVNMINQNDHGSGWEQGPYVYPHRN